MTDEMQLEYPELEPEVEEVVSEIQSPPVYSQPHDWTISALRDKYERGVIVLQPHYQREYVWEQRPELMSRLIESLLLQIPIPPLYFVSLSPNKMEVVDGQQRLTTLMRFVSNQFKLQKLEKLSSKNGNLFRELPEYDQEKIMDATIRSIVIDAGTNHDLRYEVFERLNRGTMVLNEQEIRNCAYRGNFCDLLAELENDANWRKVKGGDKPEKRFIEREMILRFFAFESRITHYAGNLRAFLNDYMGKYAPNDPVKVNELGSLFRQTMQNVYTVFGEYSARIYSAENLETDHTGHWDTKFSISALDVQASALAGHSPTKIRASADAIREAYKIYLASNSQIHKAISSRPAGKDATKTRWGGFRTIVQEIISKPASVGVSSEPLFQSRVLLISGHHLPAGNAARVILEDHMKKLVVKHNIPPLKGKPTIDPLNVELKRNGVYDQSEFLTVQLMAEIGNRSSHADLKPAAPEEVAKLIEEISKFARRYPIF